MPAACAAAGLAPDGDEPPAEHGRPDHERDDEQDATTAISTVFGMPAVFASAKLSEPRGRRDVGRPARDLEHRPGEERARAERRDERRDPELGDREAADRARGDAGEHDEPDRRRQLLVVRRSGYFVTMIVVSVIIPGTDRSRPRCWITSVWPIDAIARMAANGSIERSALLLTLPVASSGLTAKRSAVASQIERNGGSVRPRMRAITRAGRRAGPCARSACAVRTGAPFAAASPGPAGLDAAPAPDTTPPPRCAAKIVATLSIRRHPVKGD